MPRKSIAVFLMLLLGTALWAQEEHPDLKSGKVVLKNVVILPPSVKMMKSGVKGNEEMIEESRAFEGALPPVVTSVLQQHQCTVDDKLLSPETEEKDPDIRYAIADLQKQFDEMLPQLERKPKDIRKGRFTMGDEVAKLNPGGALDALVFVRGAGQVNTGGKMFLTAMAGGAVYNVVVYHIAVVDARSGAVLYYGVALQAGDPVKNPKGFQKSIEKLFKNFPGKS
jgi:hypothetical protein